jgi:hypothetical protein
MTASASKVGMSATSSSGRGTLSRVSSINSAPSPPTLSFRCLCVV